MRIKNSEDKEEQKAEEDGKKNEKNLGGGKDKS